MKIIFLDIDGVLNSEKHWRELFAKVESGEMSKEEYYTTADLPYKDTLIPLQKIVNETGAKIVLSSSWRVIPKAVYKLNTIFLKYGFKIYSKTPHGVKSEPFRWKNIKPYSIYFKTYYNKRHEFTSDRGAEISTWLSKHKDVESFVIIDDDIADIKPYYTKEHIQTDWKIGLTLKEAEEAIKLLNERRSNETDI